MENLKEMVLNEAAHKPLSWFCYVDDTFIIWPQTQMAKGFP
jgi:hypothetical protein